MWHKKKSSLKSRGISSDSRTDFFEFRPFSGNHVVYNIPVPRELLFGFLDDDDIELFLATGAPEDGVVWWGGPRARTFFVGVFPFILCVCVYLSRGEKKNRIACHGCCPNLRTGLAAWLYCNDRRRGDKSACM